MKKVYKGTILNRETLSGDQIYDREDQRREIGSHARIVEGPDFSRLFPGQLLILIDVFDHEQPDQEPVDLDASLRDLLDDHYCEYDPQSYRNECQDQRRVDHLFSPPL
ncbi:MAG: hypothetical protein M0C28_01165 [Candidatus Moduliflexus flocculans]|nr:hypothetical protein [Candidatus Moduliflexus flocculans]